MAFTRGENLMGQDFDVLGSVIDTWLSEDLALVRGTDDQMMGGSVR